MKGRGLAESVRSLLLSETFWRILPTPAIYYLNKKRVTTPVQVPSMPETEWSQRERRSLLTASEGRLRNVEGKGPGLATITAVIAAAVLLALGGGWDESDWVAKILLALATLYALLSLFTPIYLVGPLKRHTVHVADLEAAVQDARPEEVLAARSADAAMQNDLQNLRLANHLDASRRELAYALALVVLWAVLVPATGVLRGDPARPHDTSGAVAPDLRHWAPRAVRSVAAGSTVGLPRVTSTGGRITALWQAPLTNAVVTGNLVVGLAAGRPAVLEAISESTGQHRWTASLPAAEPYVAGLFAAGGSVVVEVGRALDDPAGSLVVTRYVVFDARSGRQLWSAQAPGGVTSLVAGKPVIYAAGLVVTGDSSGDLTARDAHTGALAWQSARPRSCPQSGEPEFSYSEGLAGSGRLLVVSYQCESKGQEEVLVERVAPLSGAPLWRWRAPLADLSVVGAATQGELVLLSGQAGEDRDVRSLPNARSWPTRLGFYLGKELLLALDARTGAPRWYERGGQLEEFTLTDGVTCETVHVGFECRDDQTGLHTRPVLTTGRGEGSSPPYSHDGTDGIGGSLAGVVLSQAPSGAVMIGVFPLRGGGAIAHATVQLGDSTYGEGNDKNFIVGAGPIAGGGTLMLLRRVDIANYPLVALRVSA
jgi:outer membrane protein assembly factor BamB